MTRPKVPASAATPARTRWRFSQASCFSGSELVGCGSAVTADTLVALRGRKTCPPHTVGRQLVATDDARDAVARVEHEVQRRRREPDQRLYAAPAELLI